MANVKVIVKAIACADGSVTQNGNPLFDVASGGTFDLITKLDGVVEDGTWDGVDTLDFTSAACSPVTFQINAVNKESLSSGSTFNLITKLDGAVNSGSYDAPTDTLSFTSAPCSPVAFQINGTPQESIAAGATFNLIATLDGVAGGTYTPATDTLAFTSTGGWVRPSDWIAIPSLTSANERFYGVLNVFENAYNTLSVRINSGAANINYGDGTSVVSNGGTQLKVYDYSTISATVYVWPDGRNYKQVLVDITRVGGAITSVTFWDTAGTANPAATNNFVDIICSFPSLADITFGLNPSSGLRGMFYLQRLRWLSLSNITYYQLKNMYSLRVLELPSVLQGTAWQNSMSSISADEIGNLNYGTSTNTAGVFYNSLIKKHGNLIANSVTSNGFGYAQDCLQLTQFGDITMLLATSLSGFFGSSTGSLVLTKVGVINTPNATNLSNMFFRCYSLSGVEFTNCAAVTTTTSIFGACVSLYWAIMPNLTRGISFSGTAMGNYGMNLFANSIGTASGAQTITITGTPFGALVTASDATALAIRAVMIGKGYTIAN